METRVISGEILEGIAIEAIKKYRESKSDIDISNKVASCYKNCICYNSNRLKDNK